MTISWRQPNLKALSETDGHGDTCGAIVILDYRYLAHGVALSIPVLDDCRRELISWGLMNTPGEQGMTITQIAQAFQAHYQVTPVKVVPYTANLDFNTFHNDLIAALEKHQLVLFETSDASALPDNQPGVAYHFVLVGGIDSVQGYLLCNGDTETALRSGGVVDPKWVGVGAIEASKPCGYIILPALDPVPPPPPPPGIPPQEEALIHLVEAELTSASSQLSTLH